MKIISCIFFALLISCANIYAKELSWVASDYSMSNNYVYKLYSGDSENGSFSIVENVHPILYREKRIVSCDVLVDCGEKKFFVITATTDVGIESAISKVIKVDYTEGIVLEKVKIKG